MIIIYVNRFEIHNKPSITFILTNAVYGGRGMQEMNGFGEWERFDEVSSLIRIIRQLDFYPDLDLQEFF